MTKEDLIIVAKTGFPEIAKSLIDFNNCEIHHSSGVYRLYDKGTEFAFALPKHYYLAIFIGDNKFIQFSCGSKAFNHYAAIKKMEKMGLV
ncbi:hypothetical protein [Tenacibaculum finnmarkense]|uniref:hypothetical protein n=1 Tax=Tenacibaculum finnmarkense TaxID=2781243 RepID=UPI001EFA7DFF|nr:hypothetical protein [Tenacibaculum finnmarkense]MCG8796653.1 hypothetical protein [Tenacibaculum finnmarkense]MCG8798995.1 hypothetical protein [Tenacibaculum finnmarkense]